MGFIWLEFIKRTGNIDIICPSYMKSLRVIAVEKNVIHIIVGGVQNTFIGTSQNMLEKT